MPGLADIVSLRAKLRDRRDRLATVKSMLQDLDGRIVATTSSRDFAVTSGNAADQALFNGKIAFLEQQKTPLVSEGAGLETEIAALVTANNEASASQPALWSGSAALPVTLLPVRIETRFADPPSGGGVDLLVRIYPDEVQVVAPAGERQGGARVRLLPKRWNVFAFSAGELIFQETGKPIADDLPASIVPEGGNGGPATGAARTWLIDFEAAVDTGMALRVHLADPPAVIDQLFAVGVNDEVDSNHAASDLAATLASHGARAALGFVPPGSPTNNTADTPTAWSSRTRPLDQQQQAERRAGLDPTSNQNAAVTARALGIDGAAGLAYAARALDDEMTAIGALIDAIWPAVSSVWLRSLFSVREFNAGASNTNQVEPPPDLAEALRQHTTTYVRSRGPLPALRVGRQPYGVLPVSSLDLWASETADALDVRMPDVFRDLRLFWEAGLLNVPRKTAATDQDQAILDVLARRPRSTGVVLRGLSGPKDPADSIEPLVVTASTRWDAAVNMQELRDDTESLPDDLPLVGDAEALARRWRQKAAMIRERLTPERIDTLHDAVLATHLGGRPVPRSERDLPEDAKASLRAANSLFNVLIQKSVSLAWQGSLENLVNVTPEEARRRIGEVTVAINTKHAETLDLLASLPPADYERIFLDAIDVFSHRLDAWITSLATRRLARIRASAAAGCHLGGYGWIENLKRDPAQPDAIVRVGAFERVLKDPTHTYVLAPSLHHATTAAVLRAGFESHSNPEAFAVRLTSRRARVARWILDGVRNGQPLGALLGYRFERALHDRGLDARIDDYRALFPMAMVPEHDREETGTEAREAIAAQNVVDGLALHRGAATVPAPLKQGAEDLFTDLADAIDAVGDLLLSESVHQLVGGNPIRAGLAADTLGRGESVPDRFDILRTPQSAQAVTYRLAVILPRAHQLPSAGWNRDRPRARLSPEMEAWAGHLLGPAARWKFNCQVTAGGAVRQALCGLDTLGICALDVVFESAAFDVNDSSLARRVLERAAGAQADAAVQFLPAEPGGNDWPTLTALTARLRDVLTRSAALLPGELDPLDRTALSRVAADTFAQRGNDFLRGFASALASLRTAMDAAERPDGDVGPLRAALGDVASFGVASASAVVGDASAAAGRAALLQQARNVLTGFATLGVPAELSPAPAATDDLALRGWIDRSVRTLRAIAGDSFPIPPPFRPAVDGEFARSLDATLDGGDRATAAAWLARLGSVRPRARQLHDALAGAEALGATATPELLVTQTPAGAPDGQAAGEDRWIALPFGSRAKPSAQRSIVVHAPAPVTMHDAAAEFCGILVDEWVEHLPGLDALTGTGDAQSEIAGLTFRYDQPDARPPQAILLAVPPDVSRPWTIDTLLQILRETLDLAKLRGVELRDLPRLTPLIPTTYVTLNTRSLDPVTVTYRRENPDGSVTTGSFLTTPERVDEWNSDLPL